MRQSVNRALEHWCREGLLSDEQVAGLAASLARLENAEGSARTVRVFAFIGAVLTGLGAILFVASNWQGMGPLERTLVLLAGYGVAVATAALLESRRLPVFAETMWLLSTLVLGANIFLIAQNYNLSLTLWQGTFAWMVGAVAMGYARQSAPQAAVAVPLAVLTVGWAGGGSGWFFDDQVEFLFADGGLRPLLPLIGLALVALSTLAAAREDTAFARVACLRWGTLLVASTLIITTAHVELAAAFYDADFAGRQIATLVGASLVVAVALLRGRFASHAGKVALAALLGFLAMMLVRSGGVPWVGTELSGVHLPFGLYVVAVFATALYVLWIGIRASNAQLVNLGMVSTTLIIIIQYFGWSFELLDRSVAFILGGLVLTALSFLVEKKRRGLIAQMTA
jgi:uncharacterized membrane protein